jgi:hypothetical protein
MTMATEFGGTKAVDEFLRDRNVLVQKLPQSHASPALHRQAVTGNSA